MAEQSGPQRPTTGSIDWLSPWQLCKARDRDDREDREAEKTRRPPQFDGNRPFDSPILYWARRTERQLGALTPWSQFGYLVTRKLCGPEDAPTWMYTDRRRRARYYSGDYYVLLTTSFVTLWACLTTGLTRPSSWQTGTITWILLIPVAFLLPLYVLESRQRLTIVIICVLLMITAAVLPAFFGVGDWIRWVVPWPLALRGAEILLTLARIMNFDTLEGGYMHTPVSRIRYIYYTILYVVQVSFIYCAIYAFWAPDGYYDPTRCASRAIGSCVTVTGLNNHIYLSITTLTTLGSGFVANGGLAQWLQISEVAFGILLLAVGLATFVGSLQLVPLQRNDGSA